VSVRLFLYKVDTPWMISVLWIVFVLVVGIAGILLAFTVASPSRYPYDPDYPPYEDPICYMSVCQQIVAGSSKVLLDWCTQSRPSPAFTLILNNLFFLVEYDRVILSHTEGGLRPVAVNGVERPDSGRYTSLDSLASQLVVTWDVAYSYNSSIYVLSLNYSNSKVVMATGSLLFTGSYVTNVAVINGSIYWLTNGNQPPLPSTTAYISNGTSSTTMTAIEYYGIANPCNVTPTTPSPTPTPSPSPSYSSSSSWFPWALLLFSSGPSCLAAVLVLLMYQVRAMAFSLYVVTVYSSIVFLIGCGVTSRTSMDMAFYISYGMIFVIFFCLVRSYVSRVVGGWVLLGALVTYLVCTPDYFFHSSVSAQICRILMNAAALFVGLMIPSIPLTLLASLEVLMFAFWLIVITHINEMIAFVLIAVFGLLLVVGVVQLKGLMTSFRKDFYTYFGPAQSDHGGVRDYSEYESYVEEEMMHLPMKRTVDVVV
jgi:hypothetical protein